MRNILLIALLFLTIAAWAQIPQTMHFQGFLAEPGTSTPVADGNYSIIFVIYDDLNAGNNLWTETHSTVAVADGFFSVILGSEGTPLTIDFETQYYLEVQVGGETLSPRYTLSSSAYALNARRLMSADDNVFAGVDAGQNTTGIKNTFIGARAGQANTSAIHNVFVGTDAGYNATTGNSNTFVGTGSGLNQTIGAENTFVGIDAGNRNISGWSNVYLGAFAGNFSTGNGNVFIGKNSGVFDAGTNSGETGDNKLYIENSETTTPLIYGEFDNDLVTINGRLGIGTAPLQELHIAGSTTGGVNAKIENANSAGFSSLIFENDTKAIALGFGGTTATSGTGSFYLYDNGNVPMLIDANGDVAFGSDGVNVYYDLQVAGSESEIDIGVENSTSSGHSTIKVRNDGAWEYRMGVGGTTATYGSNTLYFMSNMDLIPDFVMDEEGKIGLGRTPTTNPLEVEGAASKTVAGDWLANSDRRIKTSITEIENSFEIIKALRPVKFKYSEEWKRNHPSIEDKYYYNFIAQEYATVFPESVHGSGEYLSGDKEEVLQIDTYNAQIVTIQAVQDLIAKIEALEKENASLKASNSSLMSQMDGLKASLSRIENALGLSTDKETIRVGSEE